MTARALTIAGFVLVGAAAGMLALAGRRGRLGLRPAGELLDAVRSSLPVRLVLVLGWIWLGWHFLAR